MQKETFPSYNKYAVQFDYIQQCYFILDVIEDVRIENAPPLVGEDDTINFKNYDILMEKALVLNRKYIDGIIYTNEIIDYGS